MGNIKMRVVCTHEHNGKWVSPNQMIEVDPSAVGDKVRLQRAEIISADKKPQKGASGSAD